MDLGGEYLCLGQFYSIGNQCTVYSYRCVRGFRGILWAQGGFLCGVFGLVCTRSKKNAVVYHSLNYTELY